VGLGFGPGVKTVFSTFMGTPCMEKEKKKLERVFGNQELEPEQESLYLSLFFPI
jgi:hypothetical protein